MHHCPFGKLFYAGHLPYSFYRRRKRNFLSLMPLRERLVRNQELLVALVSGILLSSWFLQLIRITINFTTTHSRAAVLNNRILGRQVLLIIISIAWTLMSLVHLIFRHGACATSCIHEVGMQLCILAIFNKHSLRALSSGLTSGNLWVKVWEIPTTFWERLCLIPCHLT